MLRSIRFNGLSIALKSEGFVLLRSRIPWLLLVLPAVVSVLKMGIIRMKNIGTQVMSVMNSNAEATVTGYGFLVNGLSMSLIVTCLLFLGYAAYTFAIDSERGITRHATVKSISRSELILAKYLTLCILASLSVILTVFITWLAANFFWDLGPLIEDGYQIIGVDEIKKEIFLGLKLALLPLPAVWRLACSFPYRPGRQCRPLALP